MKMEELLKAYAEDEMQLGDNILAQITSTAESMQSLGEEIAADEAALKAKKERLRQIAEEDLPNLMEAAGQKRVVTRNGLSVTLDDAVFANITEENREPAFQWLVDNNHEALIRNEFVVAFPKNSTDAAHKFEDYLNTDVRRKANIKHNISVHSGTLTAWVREELEAGRELPMDLLGVRRRRVCKLK